MNQKILASTLENASFNIIFQLFFRCITFALNAFILRYISHDVVGVMNVRLLLLESTILFLSREAFRRAALSQSAAQSWQQIINLVWLTVPLSLLISVIFCIVWLNVLNVPPTQITPHYSFGVWSIAISCVIKMFAEPLFIVSQAYSFNKLRIVLASLGVLVRSVIFVGWILLNPNEALIAFSVAQLVADFLYLIGYYYYFYSYIRKICLNNKEIAKKLIASTNEISLDSVAHTKTYEAEEDESRKKLNETYLNIKKHNISFDLDMPFPFTTLKDFFPKPVNNQKWIHPNSVHLTMSFLKQGILKQILTEGEHYIMTLFFVMTFKEQGIYDIVNNLGSLVARFLFRPIEDALYYYFTQSIKRDDEIKNQNQERMKETSVVLHQILNGIIDIGLIIFTFGQNYSSTLLYVYGGESIASGYGTILLRAHSFLVLLLGVNGITECFVFSTMTADQLNKYNTLMAIFSILFLVVLWIFSKLFGGVGFILANCCNMLARIGHSIIFIKEKYADTNFFPLEGLWPTKYFFTSLCISFCVTKFTENFCNSLLHFIVGTISFIFVVIVWTIEKKELVNIVYRKWKEEKLKNRNKYY